jgi:serine/threonine-protein kinase
MAFSLQDYQIIAEIGRGGFGTVYRARQKSLGREVALKCLAPQRMLNSTEIVRFRREAEAMAALTHDNIVAVLDYACHGGNYYIVMEYIEGMAFAQALEGGLPRRCSLYVLEKVAAALRCAHAAGIIHRDVKPANILLGRNGQVKLADFGLAVLSEGFERQSAAGEVLGTIGYLAPEALVSPREADQRIDIFAFGCLLYQVLSGRPPFSGSSIGEISHQILNEQPAPIDAPGTGGELIETVMGCLAKERESRPTLAAVHEKLIAALHDSYHAAGEELTGFVRGTSAPAVQAATADDHTTIGPRLKVTPEPRRITIAARTAGIIGAALIVALLAALALPRFTTGKRQPAALPKLSVLNSSAMSEAPQSAQPRRASGRIAAGAPAPLTGPTMDMEVATLILAGLSTEDTIFLNDRRVGVVLQGTAAQIEIVPGYYHLSIKGPGKPPIAKEIELMPYQRLTVNLKDERHADGRESPP